MTAKQQILIENKVRKIVKKVMNENGYDRNYDQKIIRLFREINGFNDVYTKQLNAKTVTVDDLDNMIATYLAAVGDLKAFKEHWDK